MAEYALWGASGHALVLAEILEARGHRLIALFDNDPGVASPLPDVPVWHGMEGFRAWVSGIERSGAGRLCASVAIGGARGRDRCEIADVLATHGLSLPPVLHPGAAVSPSAVVGDGSHVLAGAVIGTRALLGRCVIVNTNASVDHECILEDGVHVAPGATLCGCIRVGRNTLIGPNAVVVPRVRIGCDVVVGAGSVVTRDLPDGVVAWGSPARIIRGGENG